MGEPSYHVQGPCKRSACSAKIFPRALLDMFLKRNGDRAAPHCGSRATPSRWDWVALRFGMAPWGQIELPSPIIPSWPPTPRLATLPNGLLRDSWWVNGALCRIHSFRDQVFMDCHLHAKARTWEIIMTKRAFLCIGSFNPCNNLLC